MEPEPFGITVAIPAYNERSRIADAIAAVWAQSEPPAEILVIDDGSSDDTAAVAESLGARVVRQANAGVSAARNLAVREARSPWIAFCDADDILLPGKLASVRLANEARPDVDFMFTDYRMVVDGRTTVPSTFALVPDFHENISATVSDDMVYFERQALATALAGTNFILPSTVVVRRRLLLERQIPFASDLPRSPDYQIAEDIEWYFRVLLHSDALAIKRVLTEHRRHVGSLSEDSGRMKYGDVILGERIARDPGRYAEGAPALFASNRRRHVRESAIYHLRALRFREGQAKLREAQQIGFVPADAVLAAAVGLACLPGGVPLARFGRRAWRQAVKPALGVLKRGRA